MELDEHEVGETFACRRATRGALSDLSVIIPSWQGRDHLQRCLTILERAASEAEVIVVDGGSTDGSPELVRARFPWVKCLHYPNHGWGHATNRGSEEARGRLLLFLNSDCFVTRTCLLRMAKRLRSEQTLGAVGPSLLNQDGTRQSVFGSFYTPNWLPPARRSVWILSGACMMTRRNVIARVGGIDENLFLYNEEYDLCGRLRRAGYRLEILPDPVVHVGGGSTSHSPQLEYESRRGFLYVARKHRWPIASILRGLIWFEAFGKKRIDQREEWREMWRRLESLTRNGHWLDSPFPLSGRGTPQVVPLERGAYPTTVVPFPTRSRHRLGRRNALVAAGAGNSALSVG